MSWANTQSVRCHSIRTCWSRICNHNSWLRLTDQSRPECVRGSQGVVSVSVRRNLRNYPPPLSRQRGHSPNGKVSVDLDLDIIFALTSYLQDLSVTGSSPYQSGRNPSQSGSFLSWNGERCLLKLLNISTWSMISQVPDLKYSKGKPSK